LEPLSSSFLSLFSSTGLSLRFFVLFCSRLVALPSSLPPPPLSYPLSPPPFFYTSRSIVTPQLLSWNPVKAAQIILTAYEQSKPWVLLKAPGPLIVTFVQVIWLAVVVKAVRHLLLPEISNFGTTTPVEIPAPESVPYALARLFSFIISQMISTFLM